MLSGIADPGESRMGEISMSGSTREREAAVIGLRAFHSVLSSLLYWQFRILARKIPLTPGWVLWQSRRTSEEFIDEKQLLLRFWKADRSVVAVVFDEKRICAQTK